MANQPRTVYQTLNIHRYSMYPISIVLTLKNIEEKNKLKHSREIARTIHQNIPELNRMSITSRAIHIHKMIQILYAYPSIEDILPKTMSQMYRIDHQFHPDSKYIEKHLKTFFAFYSQIADKYNMFINDVSLLWPNDTPFVSIFCFEDEKPPLSEDFLKMENVLVEMNQKKDITYQSIPMKLTYLYIGKPHPDVFSNKHSLESYLHNFRVAYTHAYVRFHNLLSLIYSYEGKMFTDFIQEDISLTKDSDLYTYVFTNIMNPQHLTSDILSIFGIDDNCYVVPYPSTTTTTTTSTTSSRTSSGSSSASSSSSGSRSGSASGSSSGSGSGSSSSSGSSSGSGSGSSSSSGSRSSSASGSGSGSSSSSGSRSSSASGSGSGSKMITTSLPTSSSRVNCGSTNVFLQTMKRQVKTAYDGLSLQKKVYPNTTVSSDELDQLKNSIHKNTGFNREKVDDFLEELLEEEENQVAYILMDMKVKKRALESEEKSKEEKKKRKK
jgi:hypothetical protein